MKGWELQPKLSFPLFPPSAPPTAPFPASDTAQRADMGDKCLVSSAVTLLHLDTKKNYPSRELKSGKLDTQRDSSVCLKVTDPDLIPTSNP